MPRNSAGNPNPTKVRQVTTMRYGLRPVACLFCRFLLFFIFALNLHVTCYIIRFALLLHVTFVRFDVLLYFGFADRCWLHASVRLSLSFLDVFIHSVSYYIRSFVNLLNHSPIHSLSPSITLLLRNSHFPFDLFICSLTPTRYSLRHIISFTGALMHAFAHLLT